MKYGYYTIVLHFRKQTFNQDTPHVLFLLNQYTFTDL